ncbi:MAG: TspO/MBR family protein, partial [Saonia sp.]
MKKKITYIAITVSICLLIGFLSGFATQSSVNDWYVTLNKPSFNPPNWIFAP